LVSHIEGEGKLRVLQNRALRIFGSKGEVTSGEDYITRSFTICTAYQVLFG
jgi:hypothetical protein